MIFIDLFGNPPPQELIDEGTEFTRQLMGLSPDERNDFIDRHDDYWRRLEDHYSKLSHGKCWYTEANDKASIYHMEHFRPKKRVIALNPQEVSGIITTNSREAYWWLAFDWKNYRFAASIPNTNKNSYFPLKNGTPAIKQGEDTDNEWNGLLDPTNIHDVSLIGFGIDGKVHPACANADCWDAIRVLLSIRVYDLNCISLVDVRKQIQQTCKQKIKLIKNAQREYAETRSLTYRDMLKNYIQELRDMTKPEAEFSAVARNYIRNDTEEFIRNIAC